MVMLSGDRLDRVKALADSLGIREYYTELTPEDKVRVIMELRRWVNGNILMIRDGVNDAAAMASSDVSIAMGSSVGVSKNTADIVLLSNDLNEVLLMLKRRGRLSKAIPSNIILALLYNATEIPLAILGVLNVFSTMLIMTLSLASIFINATLSGSGIMG
ncbi:MAG: HAD-IC family P-type ATPase [Caldivirga sp.]|uniref:HAD-IC family P-type ATPase n=1 Tax=Caldivirga sp. TaxID=2080243 RepID=UPI003D0BE03D